MWIFVNICIILCIFEHLLNVFTLVSFTAEMAVAAKIGFVFSMDLIATDAIPFDKLRAGFERSRRRIQRTLRNSQCLIS